jgi:putative effector of murein hydrolase LrgA (UPF0299 family)
MQSSLWIFIQFLPYGVGLIRELPFYTANNIIIRYSVSKLVSYLVCELIAGYLANLLAI